MFTTVATLPPQPDVVDGNYAGEFNVWVGAAQDALSTYRAEYEAAMAAQGVRVSWDTPSPVSDGSPVLVPPTYTATLTRDGYTSQALVDIGRAQSVSAAALANYDIQFNLKFGAQVAGNPLPSEWYSPYNLVPITPGPSLSVPVSQVPNLQPQQAPATPDAGTLVSPLQTPLTVTTPDQPVAQKYNLWEWNWFYQNETGRSGPGAEDIGIQDPRALITRDEWWAKASAWYAGQGSTPMADPGTPPVATAPPPASPLASTPTRVATSVDPLVSLGTLGSIAVLLARFLG